MKKGKFHFAGAYLLIGGLLFSQLAVNLFHDGHNFHEILSKKTESVQKHSDHCKICSIDVLVNLELVNPTELANHLTAVVANAPTRAMSSFASLALSKGRAPPFQR